VFSLLGVKRGLTGLHIVLQIMEILKS